MLAAAITRFGDADALETVELRTPRPGPGEVAIDVAYGGVNFAEVLFRRGLVPVDLPYVPGVELSGFVREIGPGVEGLELGQRVAALTNVRGGGYAEVAIAPSQLVVALGAGLVLGTVSTPEKAAYARGLGFDEVLLRDGFAEQVRELTGGRGVDVVVDPVGGPMRRASMEVLAPLGRLVVAGNAGGAGDVVLGLNELWQTGIGAQGFNLRALCEHAPDVVAEAEREALGLVRRGEVVIDVTAEFPLERAADAHRAIESGETRGKLILRVGARE